MASAVDKLLGFRFPSPQDILALPNTRSKYLDLRRKHARAAIHEVVVAWRKQEGDEFRASMQERNRSKIGRKARLRGTVESVAANS